MYIKVFSSYLWLMQIDIIMDGPPAQSLGVEPVDPEIMKKPPRSRSANILTKPLITRVLTAAFLVTVGTMFVYISEMADGVVTNKDATMVFFKKKGMLVL